jgi:hypothetical protein
MIKILETVIDETQIIGIGPLLTIRDAHDLTIRYFFSVYLRFYSIDIGTNYLDKTFEVEKSKLKAKELQHCYNALKTALQALDWNIYRTYEQELEKTKNPQG